MRISVFLSCCLLFISPLVHGQEHRLYKIEEGLINGDKNSLFEIVPYFDSKREIIEFLGYHRIATTESRIARRIVEENSLFMSSEINLVSVTTKEFNFFLVQNEDKIVFSDLANAFLITPLEEREVHYTFRSLTNYKKKELEAKSDGLLNLDWVKSSGIQTLIKLKNPLVLLKIASVCFQERNRYNRYNFNDGEYLDLLGLLTHTQIAVEDENKEMNNHIDKDYSQVSKLNLLIYFSKHYKLYKWDNEKKIFVNKQHLPSLLGKEEELFELLANENDSIALNTFTQLTLQDSSKVSQLAKEYNKADIDENYILPTFPYRFLTQLVKLVSYCKANKIDFEGDKKMQESIKLLQEDLSFLERRKIEDDLIQSLNLETITAFEYWCLIYQKSHLTYSAGRILDIFYSKHWYKLLENQKYLNTYLKKSKLFDDLGIIGICNLYLNKFVDAPDSVIKLLKEYQTQDSDIRLQIEKAITITSKKEFEKLPTKKEWEGNKDYKIDNLDKKLKKLLSTIKDSSETRDRFTDLLSQINYAQIGTALKHLEPFYFEYTWQKYRFISEDFGVLIEDIEDSTIRKEFIPYYQTHSEYELYAYYLDKAQIDYKLADNTLDYDKIYEALKFNSVSAFVGGGGSTDDNEVYSLIKLLELTFKTTLGYPKRLCNSFGIYGCDARDRAKEWRVFLKQKDLLKLPHNEPVSFNLED